jgi:hypothetical protein
MPPVGAGAPGSFDAKTEPVVLVDAFTQTFGPGHALKSVTLEIVDPKTPVTEEIEKRLPGLHAQLLQITRSKKFEHPNDPFAVNNGHLRQGF